MRLGEMTWTEIREAIASRVTAVVPLGSIEEHGPHIPTGDYIVIDEIAARAAEATGDVVAPITPFGYSEYFRNFPGTITLRPTTLGALLTDVLDCLLRHGFPRVAIFNGHAGNTGIVELVTRRFRRTRGLVIPSIAPFQLVQAPEIVERATAASRWGRCGCTCARTASRWGARARGDAARSSAARPTGSGRSRSTASGSRSRSIWKMSRRRTRAACRTRRSGRRSAAECWSRTRSNRARSSCDGFEGSIRGWGRGTRPPRRRARRGYCGGAEQWSAPPPRCGSPSLSPPGPAGRAWNRSTAGASVLP
jgi:hypothetical protein